MTTVANPFVLTFGGKPDVFFGREDMVEGFTDALESPGSVYRTLFLTGKSGRFCSPINRGRAESKYFVK